jgi:diketogulonate reductase-like aldo/keto reductase
VDYSSAQNDFNGFHSSPNYANKRAFAAIKDDGSIMAWGVPNYGPELLLERDSHCQATGF